MLGGLVSSTGQGIQNIWGSDDPPKAILNRYAAKTAKGAARLGEELTGDIGQQVRDAFATYMREQPRQEALARDQEGVLTTLRDRRLGANPNALLGDVGKTAFGFIDPNVINPLSRFDVNSNMLMRSARGLNPAAVDSTSERLRNARIASGRYYDVARDAYSALPGLYKEAYGQGVTNDAAAAGYTPSIAASYDAVASRPTRGIMSRIGTTTAGIDTSRKAIDAVTSATQGYQQPQNIWDKIGKTGVQTGQQMQQDEAQMMSMVQSAMGAMGSAEGGAGGAMGAAGGGTPAFGSTYSGPGGATFMSTPNAQGGGYSQRI
jgi:hypothetical protein